VITWASIFPLDVVKTRVQTQSLQATPIIEEESRALLSNRTYAKRLSTWAITQEAYRKEGAGVFVRGLGICSARAFVVNAVQWAIYEWMMRVLQNE
jgi:solute carrier family 25 (mitochondrial carnitine/acylcarnitine transporter), member 20/29